MHAKTPLLNNEIAASLKKPFPFFFQRQIEAIIMALGAGYEKKKKMQRTRSSTLRSPPQRARL
jgi:hypothetical protein